MTYVAFSRSALEASTLPQLKAIASKRGINPVGDKRIKATWINAILDYQASQIVPVNLPVKTCADCPFFSRIENDRGTCEAFNTMTRSGCLMADSCKQAIADCPECAGTGETDETATCPSCNGDGFDVLALEAAIAKADTQRQQLERQFKRTPAIDWQAIRVEDSVVNSIFDLLEKRGHVSEAPHVSQAWLRVKNLPSRVNHRDRVEQLNRACECLFDPLAEELLKELLVDAIARLFEVKSWGVSIYSKELDFDGVPVEDKKIEIRCSARGLSAAIAKQVDLEKYEVGPRWLVSVGSEF